jgi:hypothetical protein
MTCRKMGSVDRSRRASWAAVVIATLALVATSAPEPDYISDEASVVATAGASTLVVVRLNADANSDATGLEIKMIVSVEEPMAGDTDPPVVTIQRASTGAVVTAFEDPDSGGEGGLVFGNIADCPDDGNCRQSFLISVTPERGYAVQVTATAANDESGCPVGNPSFGDDAEIEVTLQ